MVDDKKKIEITQDFLEKHRSNTRKYMHLISKNTEKPSSIQETLNRIESKFGINIARSSSQDLPQSPPKSSDHSIQEFIQQIRAKYLSTPEPSQPPLPDPPSEKKLLKPEFKDLLELSILTPEPKGKSTIEADEKPPQKNLNSYQENLIKKSESEETSDILLISDLVSEPNNPHFSPVNKPPRKKMPEEAHENEDFNKTLNENSMSMSFRRVHAEQLMNSAISEVITSRLKIKQKRSPSKIFSFEHFLNSGKINYAPVKKFKDVEDIFRNDLELKRLVMRKEEVVREIERLDKERQEILINMNRVN